MTNMTPAQQEAERKDGPYYDESGNEIYENDLLRLNHFIGARRKRYYMYKIAVLIEGYWYGLDVHDRKHRYRLIATATDNKISGTQVIARAESESPDPKYKRPLPIRP